MILSQKFMIALQNKDTEAFRNLYEQYNNKVFITSYYILKNRHLAEDATQEVFVQIFNKINKLKSSEALSSWIYRVAINTCINISKKDKKQRLLFDEKKTRQVLEQKIEYLPEASIIRREMSSELLEILQFINIKYAHCTFLL